MARWLAMSETQSGEPAPQPDLDAPSHRRGPRLSGLPASALLAVTSAIAAIILVAMMAAPEATRSDAVFFQAPEAVAAKPFPDMEPSSSPLSTPSVPATPVLDASVLRLPGPVPSSGTGAFQYASSPGLLLGTAGPLRRYRVAVERGSGIDVEEFAAAVDEALGDERSWTRGGRLRLQRVPDRARYEFTIVLATANTAGRLCAAGGVNIRVGGRPYTSCRVTGKVILNLDRWQLSVDHLVAARVPLALYRAYVVNHEVGHQLGHRHEGCPRRGAPAPVMMQQSLRLGGCVANAWPYVDGARYAGPPV